MFLWFLFLFINSLTLDPKYVVPLTQKTWDQKINKRQSEDIWIVMFWGGYCPHCVSAGPEFTMAAKKCDGYIHFGSVDITKEQHLGMEYKIRTIPTFLIFHKDGYDDYTKERRCDSFIEGISPFYDGCLEPFREEMINMKRSKSSAIYFASKQNAPFAWKLLSCQLSRKAEFSYSTDAQLRIQLGAIKPPGIYLKNKTTNILLTSVKNLSSNVKSFFDGTYVEPEIPTQYYLPSELKSECREPTTLCVAINKEKVDPYFTQLAATFTKKGVKFFQGDDWKYKSLDATEYAIIDSSKTKYLPVSNIHDLPNILAACLNNNSKKCQMIDLE